MLQFTATRDGREVGTVEVDETTGSADEIEERIRLGTQRLGRIALERALQDVSDQTPPPCCCGHAMHSRGQRVVTVHSTFGEVLISRRVYRCEACGERSAPVDVRICCGQHRVTMPLAKRACQLATHAHFTELPTLLEDQHHVTLSHDTLIELTHDVGSCAERLRLAEARSSRKQRQPPHSAVPAPNRIWISVDGTMYCTNIREPDPEHPGQQRLVWQQMKVGCVAWEDESGVWHKQLAWGRESPEEFGASLWRLACRCGYQQAKDKLFAADGGTWCWEIHAQYFADAAGLLDWYHVSEHVHAAAKIVAPSDAEGWAQAALDQLWNQGGESLIERLESQLKGRRGKSRSALEGLQNYLIGQRNHLEFRPSRECGWPIGTGRMESSCKQLVGVRLKGPGMHWTEHGALAMTALKATDLNGHWHAFWNTLTLAT
jgi:hypothetical protein